MTTGKLTLTIPWRPEQGTQSVEVEVLIPTSTEGGTTTLSLWVERSSRDTWRAWFDTNGSGDVIAYSGECEGIDVEDRIDSLCIYLGTPE